MISEEVVGKFQECVVEVLMEAASSVSLYRLENAEAKVLLRVFSNGHELLLGSLEKAKEEIEGFVVPPFTSQEFLVLQKVFFNTRLVCGFTNHQQLTWFAPGFCTLTLLQGAEDAADLPMAVILPQEAQWEPNVTPDGAWGCRAKTASIGTLKERPPF